MTDINKNSELEEFFQGRTIGFQSMIGWTWRGQGYDEGWEPVSEEDLARLHKLTGRVPDSYYDTIYLPEDAAREGGKAVNRPYPSAEAPPAADPVVVRVFRTPQEALAGLRENPPARGTVFVQPWNDLPEDATPPAPDPYSSEEWRTDEGGCMWPLDFNRPPLISRDCELHNSPDQHFIWNADDSTPRPVKYPHRGSFTYNVRPHTSAGIDQASPLFEHKKLGDTEYIVFQVPINEDIETGKPWPRATSSDETSEE